MCRLVRPVGLCGHDLIFRRRYEPLNPMDCAEARRQSMRFVTPVRCEYPILVREYPREVCNNIICWVDVMLQQEEGWRCCMCKARNLPGRKNCFRCRMIACFDCKPYEFPKYLL